jgi:plasmid stability protein
MAVANKRLQRYTSAVATIQIRNVPDEVHRTYQARAAVAGMSLQEYMLAEIVRNARLRTPEDIVIEVERRLHAEGGEGFSLTSSADLIAADRLSR